MCVQLQHAAKILEHLLWLEAFHLLLVLSADEHVGHKVVLPGELSDDAHVLARLRVGATEAIEDVSLLHVLVVVINSQLVDVLVHLRCDANIHIAPVEVLLRGRLHVRELQQDIARAD
jgi:hypothetical protein